MSKRRPSPWQYLSGLSLLSLLTLLTGDQRWEICLVFFAFAFLGNMKVDERFRANLSSAGRDCFVLAMLGLGGLAALAALHPDIQLVGGGIVVLYVLLSLIFPVRMLQYERRGS